MMDELRTPVILKDERMGHEDDSPHPDVARRAAEGALAVGPVSQLSGGFLQAFSPEGWEKQPGPVTLASHRP
ncbi:hypothetical protein KCH_36780 [Kitasatospora cheerisanensis KCTC 2395]|uniref:Uncharacterized protein n=1 Tax=Kitasatospora cheerisanensis KCTC 2395 TaxID=1348663 RepID=A0A066Z2M0_9ACTN|nr:hypothetical protein KCH_36780 [Kitasatospora cheerisanensis KCTC 2395]